ncbi:MAG: translation initiation factor IF-2 [Candidatus Sericytochromatia bacterium]|nr:translation initiation factor IF-2 [Candidatus Sericytochromatia bacterium]
MAKTRVHELAKELDMTTKELVDLLVSWGHDDKRHAVSAVETELVAKVRQHAASKGNGDGAVKAAAPKAKVEAPKAKAEPAAKAEAPAAEAPKPAAEAPKAEAVKPAAEAPKAEAVKPAAEGPAVEAAKPEAAKPVAGAPKVDGKADIAKAEPAKAEAAKTEAAKKAVPARGVSAPMAARPAQPKAATPPPPQATAKQSSSQMKAPALKQITRATMAQQQATVTPAQPILQPAAARAPEQAAPPRLTPAAPVPMQPAASAQAPVVQQPAAPPPQVAAPHRQQPFQQPFQQPAPLNIRPAGPIQGPMPPNRMDQLGPYAPAAPGQPQVSYPRHVQQHPGGNRPTAPDRNFGNFGPAPIVNVAPGSLGPPAAPAGQRRKGPGGGPGGARPGGSGRSKGKHRSRSDSPARGPREEKAPGAPTLDLETKVRILPGMTVKDLADQLGLRETDVIKKLFMRGILATINQSLQIETAEMLVTDYGYEVEIPSPEEEDQIALTSAADSEDAHLLVTRPPVVTIMGHVDHGKTSLLDAIRKTRVTEGEAGGITQHIGAYQVDVDGRQVTFLDTPGHEAFTAMRARGAKATDIAIIVIAADDGIMPQTIEAINHVKAAKVPIIVAINKIDKANADVEKAKQGLTEFGLVPEEWGGTTVVVPVSAKQGVGLQDLLEMVLLVADMEDLKANPDKMAQGVIIESQLSRGKGAVATVLVQAGTLEVGDNFVAGGTHGKVRAMLNERGKRLKKAPPSTPVEISGFNGVPAAGDVFRVVATEKEAREIAERRRQEKDLGAASAVRHVSLENLHSKVQEGKLKELNVVIKADMIGSSEALQQSLASLTAGGVNVRVIHTGTGDVTENDVLLASASDALVIAFNVKADGGARAKAEQDGVDIRQYSIIYKVIDDVKDALEGMLEPEMEEIITGKAEVRAVFKVGKTEQIAGLYLTEGKIHRANSVRLYRAGKLIHTGKIDSLKRFKDDVREVASGYECGMSLDKYHDFVEGDIIEAFTQQAKKRA